MLYQSRLIFDISPIIAVELANVVKSDLQKYVKRREIIFNVYSQYIGNNERHHHDTWGCTCFITILRDS